jgi:hypothetical protein
VSQKPVAAMKPEIKASWRHAETTGLARLGRNGT